MLGLDSIIAKRQDTYLKDRNGVMDNIANSKLIKDIFFLLVEFDREMIIERIQQIRKNSKLISEYIIEEIKLKLNEME